MPTRKKKDETEKKVKVAAAPKATKAMKAAAPQAEPEAEPQATATGPVGMSLEQLPEYLRRRRTEVGNVVSDKMTNTVVVMVNRAKPHPLYKKIMRRSAKFMAHDELGAATGDRVRIIESRPMSKNKRWRVIEIIQRAEKI
jgi:small subunit ribosomal protein S17